MGNYAANNAVNYVNGDRALQMEKISGCKSFFFQGSSFMTSQKKMCKINSRKIFFFKMICHGKNEERNILK